jgi:Na+-transporting NADH:ubiquinone oxidoreductase subunit A
MSKIIKIRKGLEIKLVGKAETIIGENVSVLNASIRPTDFPELVPKLIKKEGEAVNRGDTVFIDKYKTEICFVSPINGIVKHVVRGDKRKLLEVVIEANSEDTPLSFGKELITESNPMKIKEVFLKSGVWPFIKQRPYGVIAGYDDTPRDIFISFFDSSPLAADFDFILKDKVEEINIALEKISLLTEGNVYINFKSGSSLKQLIRHNNKFIYNYFEGPHPAGLPGVHINKLKPINKGEIIWTINASDLPIIGHLIINGDYKPERIIALAGSEVENPEYFKTFVGADLSELIKIK